MVWGGFEFSHSFNVVTDLRLTLSENNNGVAGQHMDGLYG